MKAQSDLTGNRERRAEMTRPRFCGVTMWMSAIDTMTNTPATALSDFGLIADESKLARLQSEFATARDLIGTIDMRPNIFTDLNTNNEVNYCPAAQQWTVCTP